MKAATSNSGAADGSRSRRKASAVISELAEACRRPLFVEIVLKEKWDAAASSTSAAARSGSTRTAAASRRSGAAGGSPDGVGVGATSGSLMETETASATSSLPPPPGGAAARKRSRCSNDEQHQAGTWKDENKPWEQILSDASQILPYATEKEHAEILRYASILLLGFLLPHSTGNESVLLQNAQRRKEFEGSVADISAAGGGDETSFDPVQYVLRMDLEERLEKSVKVFASQESGELDVLADASFDLAFHSFAFVGLGPLLDRRPFQTQQVDLLHLVAMAIHPRPHYRDMIPHVSTYLDEFDPPHWQRAKRLMRNLISSQFHVRYSQRRQLVEVVADHLFLADDLHDGISRSGDPVGPLIHGAVPHLRASLRAFARTAQSPVDSHLAHVALARIACQTRDPRIVDEEWNFLLHTMAGDHTNYQCADCHVASSKKRRPIFTSAPAWTELQWEDDGAGQQGACVCLHCARGQLLSEYIARCFPYGSDIENDALLARVVGSLTDAIEWQADFWSKDDDDEEMEDRGSSHDKPKEKYAPCLLASLLSISSTLFYYGASEEEEKDEDDPFQTLTETSIQLLRHSDSGIVRAASELLVASLSHRSRKVDEYMSDLLEAVKLCVSSSACPTTLERVVAIAAQRSPAFGTSVLGYLLEVAAKNAGDEEKKTGRICACRLIAAASSNCPSAASKHFDELVSVREKIDNVEGRMHIIASVLSMRQARYLTGDTKQAEMVVDWIKLEEGQNDEWSRYQLSRHCLETGNFLVASKLYAELSPSTVSEKHFLWVSALEHIAAAEAGLAKHAVKGIPEATVKLRSAIMNLQTIQHVYCGTNENYSFQICFLLLRLDFLDLLTVFRQLTREMRLTGSGPHKYTRSFVHAQNLVKSLVALSFRYRYLNRRYGAYFGSKRSRMALRILQGASLFLASAAKKVFGDALHVSLPSTITVQSILGEDVISQPMAAFIRKLDELLIDPMDSASMEPIIRAAAVLELIEGVLMVPIPFPRDFVHPKPRIVATLALSAEPEQRDELGGSGSDLLSSVEGIPAMCFSVYCSGSVPTSFLRDDSTDQCWTILLWYSFTYNGPLVAEDDDGDDNNNKQSADETANPALSRELIVQRLPNLSTFSPVSAAILNNGNFFATVLCPPILDEGLFTMEFSLGCKDVSGREWDLPVAESSRYISIRIARSR